MSERKTATTRSVLLAPSLLLVTLLTGSSLLIVWHCMRQQVATDFSLQLNRSAITLRDAEAERLTALKRENNLLALPVYVGTGVLRQR